MHGSAGRLLHTDMEAPSHLLPQPSYLHAVSDYENLYAQKVSVIEVSSCAKPSRTNIGGGGE